jgi:hypothetical protein
VKFLALEVPAAGAGLITVTASIPAEEMLVAGIAAVNCMELTNVVTGADPPKTTVEPAVKFVPLIVSVKDASPAIAVSGEIVLIVGVTCGCWLIPPPQPARTTTVTIPKITSVLHRQKGPRNASADMACSSATRERGPVRLANSIFMVSSCFVAPLERSLGAKGCRLSIYVIGNGGQKTTGWRKSLSVTRYVSPKS